MVCCTYNCLSSLACEMPLLFVIQDCMTEGHDYVNNKKKFLETCFKNDVLVTCFSCELFHVCGIIVK